MTTNESIQYDCFRGCVVTHEEQTGETRCTYRAGCCKLGDYNWLKDASDGTYRNLFEVRFKNTRKGFYVNDSPQNVRLGDLVVVEAVTGQDLGIVTLEGPIVGRQMRSRGIDPETAQLRKIYRRARQSDIEKGQEGRARAPDRRIKARRIAAEVGLEVQIGDVEFQGDGSKAIFYYIADGRVDFRQLIKVFAEEFRIRIEMKQIGARQEAGLIGGLGICGRELCCANYISSFQSISTSAARCQDLSLNPQKLAGQCGKLKCCLNYEVANYLDAQSRIPKVTEPLQFEDGPAFLRKTDILREVMYFSYDKSSDAELFALDAADVWDIIDMNRAGQKPESLRTEPEPFVPEFVTAVGDDSISRFDAPKRKRSRGGRNRGKGRGAQGTREEKPAARNADAQNTAARQDRPAGDRQDKGQRGGRGRGRQGGGRGERKPQNPSE